MAFELSFPLLALTRAGRPWAAALGFAFHAVAQAVFQIPFASLWLLYVVFVDPERVSALMLRFGRGAHAGSRARPSPVEGAARAPAAASLVGAVLFAGVVVQGLRGQTRAFPFACYPTFQWMAGTEMPDLIVEAESPDGARASVPHGRDAQGFRSQRQWGEIWSLSGATSPVDPARLQAYLETVRRREPARTALKNATRVRFYRGYLSVVPDDRGRPPRRGALLAELPPDGSSWLLDERDVPRQ